MAIQRYNPFANLRRMENDMFGMFPRRFGFMPPSQAPAAALPVDAFYTNESLVLRAAAPGFKADNVDLSISGNYLVLEGRKETEENEYVMKERGFDAFHRTLRLPKGLQPEKADAAFEDGILTITIPKSEETKAQVHKIAIKS